jgi:phosphoglycerate kinase
MKKKTIRDIDVAGKRVVVRVDYNVPIKDGKVTDDARIVASKPTIDYLLAQGCSLVLISPLGEPKAGPEAKYSLEPVAEKASEILGKPVKFLPDCLGNETDDVVHNLQPGQIVLLENLRFHAEETANDDGFAKTLASYGDVYVDDAFAAVHRAHASMVGIPKHLPAVAGFLVEHEVDTITTALENPTRPLLAIVGGAKISTKIEILNNLLPKVNAIFVGGAMANTFLGAEGKNVGKSLQETDQYELANSIVKQAGEAGVQVFIPTDVVVTDSLEAATNVRAVSVDAIGESDIIVDLGPDSIAQLQPIFDQKGTVIWNGPVGITETPEFAKGSRALADAIIASGATSLIGGGDTAGFVNDAGLHDGFGFVSTGGGASLELMSGKELPGVAALLDN